MTKNKPKNNVKRLLDKKTTNMRELMTQITDIQDSIKKYLEEKHYTVYLCRIKLPLRVSIIVSPSIKEQDLIQLKNDFGLNDYDLETETSEHTGQYYFR